MSDIDRKHLRVVEPPVDEQPVDEQPGDRGQLMLPLLEDTAVIVLAHITNVSEQAFLWLLQEAKPDTIVDLRTIPRFDFGRLNRKAAFRLFEEMAARYVDFAHDLGISDHHDAGLNPTFFAEPLDRLVSRAPRAQRVLLLLDDAGLLDSALEVLPTRLSAPPAGRWRVRGLPRADLSRRGDAYRAEPKLV